MKIWNLPREAPPTYWNETRRPLANLLFVLPLLLTYEIGMWLFGVTTVARSGADGWLRLGLSQLGGSAAWVLPLSVPVVLLVWQVAAGHPWKIRRETLSGMLSECVMFSCSLVLVGQLMEHLNRSAAPEMLQMGTGVSWPLVGRAISFLGTGVYEEFLFRLCLIPLVYLGCRAIWWPRPVAVAGALVISSGLFALAHYLNPAEGGSLLSLCQQAVHDVVGRRELWCGFSFRVIAGLLFGWLFCTRGFGVAVGTHALYDVIVGVLLVTEL